jgi:hypothetical protein
LKWREPQFLAAVLNGALVLIVPTMWTAYLVYRSDVVRPSPPTLLSSAVSAAPLTMGLVPVSLLVGWRTYVHASAYRLNQGTVWRGPLESAAIGGGIALLLMVLATAGTWAREPFPLVIGYIAFYVSATALVGLVLGFVLAAPALLVLRIGRHWGA